MTDQEEAKMTQETQGKTEKGNINKEKKQQPTQLLSPKAGTATSSPANKTASPSDKYCDIPNVLWYMKKNGYAGSIIKATGERLRSLQRNCN